MILEELNLPKMGIEKNDLRKSFVGHGVRVKTTIHLYEFTCGHKSCSKICRVNLISLDNDLVEEIDSNALKQSEFVLVNNQYYCSYCAPFHSKE